VTNESAGRVEFYDGPLPTAGEGSTVNKVILVSAPAEIHVDWDFGFPGSATFDASSELEFRILSQSGGSRTVAAFRLTDLALNYGYELFGGFDADCHLLPPECNTYFNVARVFAEFTATPGIDAMVLAYDLTGAQQLDPAAATGPDGNEYVPRLSFLMEDLTSITGEARSTSVWSHRIPGCVRRTVAQLLVRVSGDFNWTSGILARTCQHPRRPRLRRQRPLELCPAVLHENNRINLD